MTRREVAQAILDLLLLPPGRRSRRRALGHSLTAALVKRGAGGGTAKRARKWPDMASFHSRMRPFPPLGWPHRPGLRAPSRFGGLDLPPSSDWGVVYAEPLMRTGWARGPSTTRARREGRGEVRRLLHTVSVVRDQEARRGVTARWMTILTLGLFSPTGSPSRRLSNVGKEVADLFL